MYNRVILFIISCVLLNKKITFENCCSCTCFDIIIISKTHTHTLKWDTGRHWLKTFPRSSLKIDKCERWGMYWGTTCPPTYHWSEVTQNKLFFLTKQSEGYCVMCIQCRGRGMKTVQVYFENIFKYLINITVNETQEKL